MNGNINVNVNMQQKMATNVSKKYKCNVKPNDCCLLLKRGLGLSTTFCLDSRSQLSISIPKLVCKMRKNNNKSTSVSLAQILASFMK